ncbi:hypothetical protein CFP56_021517 [Quercus suber]|uniref:Uncharacterized protein n=1 Tax=Quercus suber TaxID=58331 RepID=A0AAW0LZE3_QUESU
MFSKLVNIIGTNVPPISKLLKTKENTIALKIDYIYIYIYIIFRTKENITGFKQMSFFLLAAGLDLRSHPSPGDMCNA